MPSRRLRQPSPIPLHRRILRGISNAGGYIMRGIAAGRGANAPANAPVIGQPRLISSTVEPPSDNLPGRLRTHATNEDANEQINQPASPADDPELTAHRVTEVCRRLQMLCNDNLYLHLSADDRNNRAQLLDWYRENRFIGDLAIGRHDGFTEALGNQGELFSKLPYPKPLLTPCCKYADFNFFSRAR